MKTNKFFTLAIAIVAATTTFAQQKLNPDEFIFPMPQLKAQYSSNFGEFRPNHFHAGVDIKTWGVEGYKVVAIADGYISRILVSPSGYGNAIYITHTNNTTSVYGHLSRFTDSIAHYVNSDRYGNKQLRRNVYPIRALFPVKQGDVIGYSGNSGGSYGPHLHFEIRDYAQRPLNMLQQGVAGTPIDNISPYIVKLHYMAVDTLRTVPVYAPRESYPAIKIDNGKYQLESNPTVEVGRNGYFVVEATDRREGVTNTFGIYRAKLSIDGKCVCEYQMDGFSFTDDRLSNAVSYYPIQRGSSNEVLRFAAITPRARQFYPTLVNDGIISIPAGTTASAQLEVEDDMGNISTMNFKIKGAEQSFAATDTYTNHTVVSTSKATTLISDDNKAKIQIPSGAVYEAIFAELKATDRKPRAKEGVEILSPVYKALDYNLPLQMSYNLTIEAEVAKELQPHTCIATLSPAGTLSYIGDGYSYPRAHSKTSSTGDVVVVADTEKPTITPQFESGATITNGKISFKFADNFSGIGGYSIYIDGKWVICEYHPIKKLLTYTFDHYCPSGKHQVEVRLGDNCGNWSRWNGEFVNASK